MLGIIKMFVGWGTMRALIATQTRISKESKCLAIYYTNEHRHSATICLKSAYYSGFSLQATFDDRPLNL